MQAILYAAIIISFTLVQVVHSDTTTNVPFTLLHHTLCKPNCISLSTPRRSNISHTSANFLILSPNPWLNSHSHPESNKWPNFALQWSQLCVLCQFVGSMSYGKVLFYTVSWQNATICTETSNLTIGLILQPSYNIDESVVAVPTV